MSNARAGTEAKSIMETSVSQTEFEKLKTDLSDELRILREDFRNIVMIFRDDSRLNSKLMT